MRDIVRRLGGSSIFAKAGTADVFREFCFASSGGVSNTNFGSTYVDFDTGVVTTEGGALNMGAQQLANDWWRVWVFGQADNDNPNLFTRLILDAVGETAYVTGLQSEVGSGPSSYIPTTGTSATRAADTLTFKATGTNDWTLTFDDGSTQAFPGVSGDLVLTRADINRGHIMAYRAEAA